MCHNKCWKRCREVGTFTHLLTGIQIGTVAVKKSLAVPQKVKHRVTI